jgi:hypothetical protein
VYSFEESSSNSSPSRVTGVSAGAWSRGTRTRIKFVVYSIFLGEGVGEYHGERKHSSNHSPSHALDHCALLVQRSVLNLC